MEKESVAVLFGGPSAEHEISVITALQTIAAIDSIRYHVIPVYLGLNGKWYTGETLLERGFYRRLPGAYSTLQEVTLLPDPSIQGLVTVPNHEKISLDLCLLAFHGQYGEDGCVQGLLELADIPYTGCGVASSAVGMNKFLSKSLVEAHGLAALPSALVHKKEAMTDLAGVRKRVLEKISYPLFVKPNHLGSSIGVAKACDELELNAALAKVFQYDEQALIEPCLQKVMEINVAVVDGSPPSASVVEIPISFEGALSYEDKYLRGGAKVTGGASSGMAGLSRVIDPDALDPLIKDQVISYALKAFDLLDCSGVCRFDFMYAVSEEKLYFNEVNPLPGSFAYYLWDKCQPKVLFTDLIERLLEKAKEKKNIQRSLTKEFGFYAL